MTPMTPEEATAVAIEIADAWNRRDLPRFLEHMTDDVEWDDPAMFTPAKGRAGVAQFAHSVLRAFPDFEYTIRHPICVAPDGSRCAVPWRITGTHLRTLEPPGYGATHRSALFEGVDLLEFRGSLVCRIETLFDVLRPAEQLLSIRLRPKLGSVQQKLAVSIQRARAFWLRRVRKVRTARPTDKRECRIHSGHDRSNLAQFRPSQSSGLVMAR